MTKLPFDDITISAVQATMIEAIAKHGRRTPLNPHMLNPDKFIILCEEGIGEVARACTYDEGNPDNLMKELLQTAAMALAWAQSLDWPGRGAMVPMLRRPEQSQYTRLRDDGQSERGTLDADGYPCATDEKGKHSE